MADKWIQLMSEDGTDNLFPTSHMDLLWTNASPNSSFLSQTISMDLSNYKHLIIEFKNSGSYTDNKLVYLLAMAPIGLQSQINHLLKTDVNHWWLRKFTANINGITFDVGTILYLSSSSTTDNNIMIPYRIYGIK